MTGTWEPPRGLASLEKTLTEAALGDHGRRHLDNRGGPRLVGLAVCVVAHYLVT
jgi:hypothetical protein